MPKKDVKITNLFKEKKKYKRQNIKNLDGNDSSEEKLLKFESNENNKRFKLDNSKFAKITKDIINDIASKSTIETSKKSLLEEEKKKSKDKNIFDLSSHTKKIISKIMSKKKREKENQISNKENDSSLLLLPPKSNKKSLLLNNKESNSSIDSFFKKNENKKSPPKLSLTTIEIMKKIKQDRKNRFDRPENTDKTFRNESSFSTLKLKYDELLSKSRELRLPLKYKQLLYMFNSLEQAINLNKISLKNNLNTFDNIRANVEYITGHSFNLTNLQQILYIVPHFYILKYIEKTNKQTFQVNNSLNKDYDLLIDIPKDHKQRISTDYPSDFNFLTINYYKENDNTFSPEYNSLSVKETKTRKEIFRNILNRIVNIYHKEYLKKNNITINFDPLIQKTWYHSFDPDLECPGIPLFEIPQPPNKISVFENTIMKNDLKNQIMKDALSLIKKDSNNSSISKSNTASSSVNGINMNKYVSKSFLEKIRAKEKANAIVNEIQNYNSYINNKKDYNSIYKEVLMQMKTILLVNDKRQKIGILSELLLNSSKLIKDTFNDKEKMEEIIEKISEKFKEFISIKNHSFLGRIVVLKNDDFDIPSEISLDN